MNINLCESSIKIDSLLSSKHEIVFRHQNNFNRVLLKIKNSYCKEISDKFRILTKDKESSQYILPFTYNES